MKKISVMLVLLGSALGVTSSVHAANGGTLNFTGALTNTSCDVSSGGGSADNIPVDLGRVSFADIGFLCRYRQPYRGATGHGQGHRSVGDVSASGR